MGGKRNKSKKFLRAKFQKKHNTSNKSKKKNANKDDHPAPPKQNPKQIKKSRELFNAGINALDEQPQLDLGLTYNKSDLIGDIDNDSLSGGDGDNDLFSDVTSLQSELTLDDDLILEIEDESVSHHIIDNEFDDLLDDLNNKDINIRIESLNKLNNKLRSRKINENDLNQTRLQLLYKYLSSILRKNNIKESMLSLDMIALICITLTEGLDFFIRNFQSLMLQLIQRPKSAVLQIKAINIWSIMIWSLNQNDLKIRTLKLFEYFWNYNQWNADKDSSDDNDNNHKKKKYKSKVVTFDLDSDEDKQDNDSEESEKTAISGDIMASAMDAWLFLITSIGTSSGIGLLLDSYFNILLNLLKLDSTSVNEKIHIGKALTVLIDNYSTALDDDAEFEKQNVDLEEVMNEFKSLKSDSKQHRKKEFAIQKTKFRDYLKTLEHKWTPIVVIKLHHKKFELNGWNKWIQFHQIKKLLKSGLQPHLLQNISLKTTFNIEIDAERILLSKKEKKNNWKVNVDKQRNIKKDRTKKRDKKNGFQFDNE